MDFITGAFMFLVVVFLVSFFVINNEEEINELNYQNDEYEEFLKYLENIEDSDDD